MQRPLRYLSTIDKYIGKYFVFTPEEVMEADRLEKIWKESQINYTLPQLLEIFPDALPLVKKNLKTEIKKSQTDIVKAEEVRTKYNNKILSRVKFENKWFWSLIRDMLYVEPLTEGREEKIKKNRFLLSLLNPNKNNTVNPSKITEADIAQTKLIPIEHYYTGKLRKQGDALVGRCPFHKDAGPSFYIYTQERRWWCYSENIGGDLADYVMRLHNCKFLDAIKLILNK